MTGLVQGIAVRDPAAPARTRVTLQEAPPRHRRTIRSGLLTDAAASARYRERPRPSHGLSILREAPRLSPLDLQRPRSFRIGLGDAVDARNQLCGQPRPLLDRKRQGLFQEPGASFRHGRDDISAWKPAAVPATSSVAPSGPAWPRPSACRRRRRRRGGGLEGGLALEVQGAVEDVGRKGRRQVALVELQDVGMVCRSKPCSMRFFSRLRSDSTFASILASWESATKTTPSTPFRISLRLAS